jgi:hypothetical protein
MWHWVLVLVICAGMGVAAKAYRVGLSNEPRPPAVQDVMNLDRRIGSLEQRFYALESVVRRLEQQALISERRAPAQPTRDPEIDSLRSEVEILKGRIRELECAAVHLDERTLSASAKEARRGAEARAKDPCRLNPEAPVRLSMRQ